MRAQAASGEVRTTWENSAAGGQGAAADALLLSSTLHDVHAGVTKTQFLCALMNEIIVTIGEGVCL